MFVFSVYAITIYATIDHGCFTFFNLGYYKFGVSSREFVREDVRVGGQGRFRTCKEKFF